MDPRYIIRKGKSSDVRELGDLIDEWLGLSPHTRTDSIADAVAKQEILVAASSSHIMGFIHYVKHNDVIDGAPNAFITAFFVKASDRRTGIGTSLLENMIADVKKTGVVAIETSTTQAEAKSFYQKRGFKQASGDIGETFLELELAEAQ